MTTPFPVAELRAQFPGLSREVAGRPAVFFDGPAGSQTPQRVIDAVARYLIHTNANVGGDFATGVESDAALRAAHESLADLVGSDSPDEIVFGPNMTSLTLMLSAALARTWEPGDEIVVTRLDHDANVTPWVEAARDAGAIVHHVGVRADDCTLDLDDLKSKLSDRTRLVAVGAASNLVGTINPVAEIARLAHERGALVFVDAVHYAPHGAIDVGAWDCDFTSCSAYKFFGPHVGVLWGRSELLRSLPVRKLRPATDAIPGRWMQGTQNHEGIVGAAAAVDYLADLGRLLRGGELGRREAILAAFAGIVDYEQELARQLLGGLASLEGVRIWGIRDPSRVSERTPTVAFTHARRGNRDIARQLADAGVFAWPGNSYALPLTEALELEPDGVVRVGLLHYNTPEEVGRLVETLASAS